MTLEQKLDVEFARLGLKPYVYHFTKDVEPFRAITIACLMRTQWANYNRIIEMILSGLYPQRFNKAKYMRINLRDHGIYGVEVVNIERTGANEEGQIR